MTYPPGSPPPEDAPGSNPYAGAQGGYPSAPPPAGGYPSTPPPPGDRSGWGMPSTMSAGDERTWAMLSHLGSIVCAIVALAFLAPLLVLLVKGDSSPFVRKHAVESLNFQITGLILLVVLVVPGFLIAVVTLGLALFVIVPLVALYGVFWVVCIVLASVRANAGEEYRYPLTLRLVS
jgi:uncharacterized Tic20 family protein